MAILVSPGVSVTVTDESYFIPATAPTVPLIFIATADEKKQPNGIDDALGTFEYGVVRSVSSLKQSVELYGSPRYVYSNAAVKPAPNTWAPNPWPPADIGSSGTVEPIFSSTGNPHHGDARNEYGLTALNTFLGVGNLAYVVRGNVNLNDEIDSLRALWDRKIASARSLVENLINRYINNYNLSNGYTPANVGQYIYSVDTSVLNSQLNAALADVFSMFSFSHVSFHDAFWNDHTALPLDVYANGFDQPATTTYNGVLGDEPLFIGTYGAGEWTSAEAGIFLVDEADTYKYTQEFMTIAQSMLGPNDASRRTAISTALSSVIQNTDHIRAEGIEYNLILAPGFHEVVDEMLSLSQELNDYEALVIGETPMNLTSQEFSGAGGWTQSVARYTSPHVAYYYPHPLMSNLDGREILGPASAVALRTMAYSDNVSFPWIAPAGIRRGSIVGITNLGYASGDMGYPTSFVELHLSNGQRDEMYGYTSQGGINPLVFLTGRGFLVWGQKTSTRETASAMDRVNVSRLLKYIKRGLRKGAMPFVFEPNDQITRNSLKSMVDGFLGDLVVKRGLYDFATQCDENNNTPDRIDRNELYIDVALKPVKAAEFIYIPIRVVSTGANIK